jgi:hypothetical protein
VNHKVETHCLSKPSAKKRRVEGARREVTRGFMTWNDCKMDAMS